MPKKGRKVSYTNAHRTKKGTRVRSPGWKSSAGARKSAANRMINARRGRQAG